MLPEPFRPLFDRLVLEIRQRWIAGWAAQDVISEWKDYDFEVPDDTSGAAWEESYDEMVLQEFWSWGPFFGCWRKVSEGCGDRYVQCFPEWQIFTKDGEANIVPGIRDRDIARLVETIPRELHEPIGYFYSIQWQILDAVLIYPPFQDFLINEIRHVGPGFIAASFLYGKYGEHIDSERIELMDALMHRKRAGLLSELSGLKIERPVLRALRLLDLSSWPAQSILELIEIICAHENVSKLMQVIERYCTEVSSLAELRDFVFPVGKIYPPPPINSVSPLVPLMSTKAVIDEAKTMEHCIMSYVHLPFYGRHYYYAWCGEDRATVELSCDVSKGWYVSQARGYRNAILSDETIKQIHRALGL